MRLQLKEVPYDLLRTADAILPRNVTVLLVTPGHDVRHHEYTLFHRALYFLAPRSVWWLAPAPPDGSWESRWWIFAPLTPESVHAIAADKGASYILAYDLRQPLAIGQRVIDLDGGSLLRVDEGVPSWSEQPVRPTHASALWPIQVAAALGTILLLGYVTLGILVRMGYHTQRIEGAALAWPLGAGLISVGMLWLDALGLPLRKQIVTLTVLTLGTWVLARNWKLSSDLLQHSMPSIQHSLRCLAFSLPLLSLLALQVIYVTISAVGQPLHTWDSWVVWGMKARAIFLDGSISPAVYADPSRTVTQLDYPLLVSLVEAWLYGWLGAPDDRLVGLVSVLFYLALVGVCHAAVRRRGATWNFATVVAVVVASIPHVAGLSGLVFADVPLAVFVTIAAVYLVEWIEDGPSGALAIAALAAGLMPWTKREGIVLLAVLCVVTLLIGRGTRRAWLGVGALFFAAMLLSSPWWIFVTWNGIANSAYLPVTMATFLANLDRLPSIGWRVFTNLLSPAWSFIWPLSVLCGLFGRRATSPATGPSSRWAINLLPLTAFIYVGLMSLGYVFSAFVPYQQHIASSLYRLMAHVTPLPVLWMTYRGIEER